MGWDKVISIVKSNKFGLLKGIRISGSFPTSFGDTTRVEWFRCADAACSLGYAFVGHLCSALIGPEWDECLSGWGHDRVVMTVVFFETSIVTWSYLLFYNFLAYSSWIIMRCTVYNCTRTHCIHECFNTENL